MQQAPEHHHNNEHCNARPSVSAPVTVRPRATFVIEPHRGLFDLDLKTVWQYKDLLYFLVWRDVKIRYKQTIIGVPGSSSNRS